MKFNTIVKICKYRRHHGGHYFILMAIDTPPESLMYSTMSPMVKTVEGERVGERSLTCNILGLEGRVGALGWGLGRVTSKSIIHMDLDKLNNKLVNV
jgi:hypothetical protein